MMSAEQWPTLLLFKKNTWTRTLKKATPLEFEDGFCKAHMKDVTLEDIMERVDWSKVEEAASHLDVKSVQLAWRGVK